MKKRTRWLLIAVSLVALASLSGVAWLIATEAGLARVVAMLDSLDKVNVHVTGARGRLIGPLQVDSIVIEHPRATIRVNGLAVDLEPTEILAGRISAEQLQIAAVTIVLHERTQPPAAPAFFPRWLTLAIDDFAIADLSITSPQGAGLRLRKVAGSVSITRSRIQFDDVAADAGAWAVAAAAGSVLAREPIAIEGGAAWSLTAERDLVGIIRASGNLDRMQAHAQIAVPGRATADIELTDLAGEFRWTGKVELEKLDLAQWFGPSPIGPLSATIDASGDRSSYAATGRIRGEGLPETGVGFGGAAGYADGLVTVSDLNLTMPGNANVRLRGTISVAERPEFTLGGEWTDFAWPLSGPALVRSRAGSLQAQGWREFCFSWSGKLESPGLPHAEGRASGRFTATQFVVEESSWQTLGGRVEAFGMLTRDLERAWTISGNAHGIDPSTLREDLPGRLTFAYAASGSGLDKDARWTAAASGLSGQFRGQSVGGGGIVRRQPGLTQFERVAFAIGPAKLTLDGALGRGTALDARLVADDLSGFLPGLGGHIDAKLRYLNSSIILSFTGHSLAWDEQKADVLSVDARIDLEDRETSWLRLRTAGMRIAGQTLTDTRLSLDGLLRDHSVGFRVGAGEDAVELRGSGAYDSQGYTLDAASLVATGPGIAPYQFEAPTRLFISADKVELASTCLVQEARRVCVEGHWQRAADWWLRASAQAFPLETLELEIPGRPSYRGLLSMETRVSGRAGQRWNADLQAEIRNAVLEFQTASGKEQVIELGRTLLTLASNADRHRVSARLVDAAASDLTLDLVAERRDDTPLAHLPVSGRVLGTATELDLLPLLFEDIDRAAGRLALDFAISGQLASPLLRGKASLTGGSLDFYQANLRLRDIAATLELQQSALSLHATAMAGDGTLAVDGRLNWQDRQIDGLLTMKGERLLLVNVPEARVLASPDLRFTLADRRINVTGSVAIPEARIIPAETAGVVLVSTDEHIVRTQQDAGQQPSYEVASDLRLLLGNKVDLDAYGLSGRITGTVRARSEPREAAVASGELEIQDGRYRAYTRELDVERGRLLFTGGPVTDPGVDLRASRKLPGYTVGVIVRGRLRRPQLTLYSEPPLPQPQIASLLIVGRTLDSLQDEDRSSLDAERAGLVAQGGALLAGELGRHVGLDEVGVAQEVDSGTALVLGKFLSPRLYISYGISLVDEINTLKLRYTIGDRWMISTESGRQSAIDIGYRVER
ncbi:MAG: translocation/assembly module TamB domain-containing protein [Gammaproteobacteria bacterium]|nr:translocation/assembly module TamB domain-containing protein [Gammaproteobacteria bacterium]